MAESIKHRLLGHNIQRDDASRYIGELLVRQRVVNRTVLDFSQEYLSLGSFVIDACAGPEGSLLPAAIYGYQWLGNEVTQRFASNLAKSGASRVVISDFSQSPYQSKIADAVFFIFALNNINDTPNALAEAARVTHDRGIVVASDPGPTISVARMVTHSLLGAERSPIPLKGNAFERGVPEFFADKNFTADEYTDYLLERVFGVSRHELRGTALSIFGAAGKQSSHLYAFHSEIVRHYFNNLQREAQKAGFKLVKSGLTATGKKQSGEWETANPILVDPSDWMDQLLLARRNKNSETLFDQIGTASTRLVYPILVFSKN